MELAKSKDNTLGRLYTLRAGLSVVAQEKYKADSIMNQAHANKKNVIADADKRIDRAEEQVKEEQHALTKLIDEEEELRRKANSRGLVARAIIWIIRVIGFTPAAAVLAYAISVICCWSGAFGKDWENNDIYSGIFTWTTYLGPWAIILLVGAVVILVFMGLGICAATRAEYSYKEKKSAIAKLAKHDAKLTKQRQKIDKAELNVSAARKEKTSDIKAADAQLKEAQKQATDHAVAGLAVIDGLENSFSDMIDIRDWANVDLIIYALETRRAESIKEALGVVDHERHTERIEQAVTDAGREICKSIQTGLKRLQGEMTRCFGLLSDQITLQTKVIANEMSGIRSGIAANNEYVARLTSQANMNNALLAKANENSSALVSDVQRLRTASEYEQARLIARGY